MAVQLDFEMVVDGRVDKPQQIFLAGPESPRGASTSRAIGFHVLAIEKIVGCIRWTLYLLFFLQNVRVVRVKVSQEYGTEIFIVIGRMGPIDHQGTKNSISVLELKMAVVPRCPVFGHLERVGFRISWGKRAFRDAIDTVHIVRFSLTQSVPVYTGAVVLHLIVDGDLKGISPVRFNCWSWVLPIDCKHIFGRPIWRECGIDDVEGVLRLVRWLLTLEAMNERPTLTTLPVLGHDMVVSVLMSNPRPQHDRDEGVFAQNRLGLLDFTDDASDSAPDLAIDSADTVELSAIKNAGRSNSIAAVCP